jgi:cytoskeletal protein CcmA (bactofilin family)
MLFNKKGEDDLASDFNTARKPVQPIVAMGDPIAASRKASSAQTRSVIDAWLTITGNLESEGEVQVDGHIRGDICCAHLTVGRDAIVDGNITADEVIVRGRVKGMIRANRVILQDCAHVESEIFHKKLAIEEGANFQGNSRRCEDPMNAAIAPAAAQLQSVAADMKQAQQGDGKYDSSAAAA